MRSGNGTVVCENMILNKLGLEEMVGRGSLHAGNFVEVNYDRWMEDTWATIARLYHFLGVQLTPDTVQEIQVAYSSFYFYRHVTLVSLKEHFNDESERLRKSYLSTFQGSSHNKDQWMRRLSTEQKRFIQSKCGNLIDYMEEEENENYEDDDESET